MLRWYDPSTGRFINEDPAGLADGANLYWYTHNNPYNGTDPTGTTAQGNPLNNLFGSTLAGPSFSSPAPTFSAQQLIGGPISLSGSRSRSTSVSPALQTSILSTELGYSGGLSVNDYSLAPRTVSTSASRGTASISTASLINSFSTPAAIDFSVNGLLHVPASRPSVDVNAIYSNRYQNDASLRNAIDDYYAYKNAMQHVRTGTVAQAAAGGFIIGLNNAAEGLYPGVGEYEDAAALFGRDSSVSQRVVAGASLGLNVITVGAAPNLSPAARTLRTESQTLEALADFNRYSHQVDTFTNNSIISQIDAANLPDTSKIFGPYSYLVDPPNVGPAKPFSEAQRKRLLSENRGINEGVLKSDESGVQATIGPKPGRGVKRPPNEAQIDHIVPLSKGGTNSYSNAQILTREENLKKGNRR